MKSMSSWSALIMPLLLLFFFVIVTCYLWLMRKKLWRNSSLVMLSIEILRTRFAYITDWDFLIFWLKIWTNRVDGTNWVTAVPLMRNWLGFVTRKAKIYVVCLEINENLSTEAFKVNNFYAMWCSILTVYVMEKDPQIVMFMNFPVRHLLQILCDI